MSEPASWVPLLHLGHWTGALVYAVPLLVILAALGHGALRRRLRARSDGRPHKGARHRR